MVDCYFSSECKNSDKTEERGRESFQSRDAKKTDGRQTHTDGDATRVALSHINTATLGKHQTQPPLFCQSSQTYSFRSISSIHNHQPRSSQPFQVPGRRGPDMPLPPHNRRANYKGSSNKWALCGVSKTHGGGGGRKCSLSCHHHHHQSSPPHPYQPSHPQQKQSERLCGRHSRAGEREEIVKRGWKEWRRVDEPHMPSPR